jgi:hypothetical protein
MLSPEKVRRSTSSSRTCGLLVSGLPARIRWAVAWATRLETCTVTTTELQRIVRLAQCRTSQFEWRMTPLWVFSLPLISCVHRIHHTRSHDKSENVKLLVSDVLATSGVHFGTFREPRFVPQLLLVLPRGYDCN